MQKAIETVGVVVIQDTRVLLVKHGKAAQHLTDTYGLPSGRVESDEDFKTAAQRELLEETGLTALDLQELSQKYSAEILRKDGSASLFNWTVFVCRKYEGELSSSEETIPEWVSIADLGKFNLLPNVENAVNQAMEKNYE